MKDKELRKVLTTVGLIAMSLEDKNIIYSGFNTLTQLQKTLMSMQERMDLILKHLELEVVFCPEETKLIKVKKQLKTSS